MDPARWTCGRDDDRAVAADLAAGCGGVGQPVGDSVRPAMQCGPGPSGESFALAVGNGNKAHVSGMALIGELDRSHEVGGHF